DVVVEGDRDGQTRDPDARFEVDELRPAAEEAIGRRIGDPVDPPRGAPCRRAMNSAGATPAAGAMDIEEDDAIALPKLGTVNATKRTTHLLEHAGRDVIRNDRIRHSGEAAVPQVDRSGERRVGKECIS